MNKLWKRHLQLMLATSLMIMIPAQAQTTTSPLDVTPGRGSQIQAPTEIQEESTSEENPPSSQEISTSQTESELENDSAPEPEIESESLSQVESLAPEETQEENASIYQFNMEPRKLYLLVAGIIILGLGLIFGGRKRTQTKKQTKSINQPSQENSSNIVDQQIQQASAQVIRAQERIQDTLNQLQSIQDQISIKQNQLDQIYDFIDEAQENLSQFENHPNQTDNDLSQTEISDYIQSALAEKEIAQDELIQLMDQHAQTLHILEQHKLDQDRAEEELAQAQSNHQNIKSPN